ncbi:hypothetical protein L873DRAFT_776894 [Choiromyces venosus 120613-1]|uniref:Uncharacterized protein n=1 Tax=Choiromyces venosus 120613-1 TaxID=1336337 RepID=A0A3N4JQT0_9PEZI|nr:hypothetical protein L873DRAFT_776894 [Choiromyces venosus 120613-1]
MSGQQPRNNFNGNHQLSLCRCHSYKDLRALHCQHAASPPIPGNLTQGGYTMYNVATTHPHGQYVAGATNQAANGFRVGSVTQVSNQTLFGRYSGLPILPGIQIGVSAILQFDYQQNQQLNVLLSNQHYNPYINNQASQQLNNFQVNQQWSQQQQLNHQQVQCAVHQGQQ